MAAGVIRQATPDSCERDTMTNDNVYCTYRYWRTESTLLTLPSCEFLGLEKFSGLIRETTTGLCFCGFCTH